MTLTPIPEDLIHTPEKTYEYDKLHAFLAGLIPLSLFKEYFLEPLHRRMLATITSKCACILRRDDFDKAAEEVPNIIAGWWLNVLRLARDHQPDGHIPLDDMLCPYAIDPDDVLGTNTYDGWFDTFWYQIRQYIKHQFDGRTACYAFACEVEKQIDRHNGLDLIYGLRVCEHKGRYYLEDPRLDIE